MNEKKILPKSKKQKIIVGYYWWIFRVPEIINFFKPMILHDCGPIYTSEPHYNSFNHYVYNHDNLNYSYDNFNHDSNKYNNNFF